MDFTSISDWPAYVRDVVRGGDHPELAGFNPDATSPAAVLGLLSDQLAGSSLAAALADGAVALIEQGSSDEARAVLTIPLAAASDAASRIARAVTSRRSTYDDIVVDGLFERALEVDAQDPTLLAAILTEAQRSGRGARILQIAVRFRPDWVAAHLDLAPTSTDADGKGLLRVLGRTNTPDLPIVVDAIAKQGQDYVDRIVAAIASWPEVGRARVLPALETNAAFRGRVKA